MSTFLDLALLVLSILWWLWFARRMDGIHAETKRAADAMEAINLRQLRRETAERQARAVAETQGTMEK